MEIAKIKKIREIHQEEKLYNILIIIRSIAVIFTLSESVHKWASNAIKVRWNLSAADNKQSPSSFPIFINRELSRKNEIFFV